MYWWDAVYWPVPTGDILDRKRNCPMALRDGRDSYAENGDKFDVRSH